MSTIKINGVVKMRFNSSAAVILGSILSISSCGGGGTEAGRDNAPGAENTVVPGGAVVATANNLSLIHISEPTRPRLISYAVF